MNAARKNSSLTPKKAAKPAENSNVSDAYRLCGINFKISVGDFGGKNKYIGRVWVTSQKTAAKETIKGLELTKFPWQMC